MKNCCIPCDFMFRCLTIAGAQSDSEISVSSEGTGRLSEQGYISDSELYKHPHKLQKSGSESDVSSVNSTGWLMVSSLTLCKSHISLKWENVMDLLEDIYKV